MLIMVLLVTVVILFGVSFVIWKRLSKPKKRKENQVIFLISVCILGMVIGIFELF